MRLGDKKNLIIFGGTAVSCKNIDYNLETPLLAYSKEPQESKK